MRGRWTRPTISALAFAWMSAAPAYAQNWDRSAIPNGVAANLDIRELGGADGGLTLSPDGRYLAVIERSLDLEADAYTHTLMLINTRTGETRAGADAGGFIHHSSSNGRRQGAALLRRAVWSPDGRRIAYLFGGAGDRVFLDVASGNGGSVRRIFDGPGEVHRFAWIDDTHLVIESGAARTSIEAAAAAARRDGFLLDARLEPLMGLMPEHDPRIGRSYTLVDVESGVSSVADETTHDQLSGALSSAPSRASLRRALSEAGEVALIRALPALGSRAPLQLVFTDAAGVERVCPHAACTGEISGPWLARGRVLFLRVEAPTRTTTTLYEWDPRSNALRRVRSSEELLVECVYAAHLMCLREATLSPRTIVSINPHSGRSRTLYDPNPAWRDRRMPRVDRLDATDRFGNPTFAHLVYPLRYDARRSYPMVIVQYRSRGFLRGGVGGEIPIHALAERGYFVLSFERPQHVADRTTQSNAAALVQEELEGLERESKLSALYALVDMALTHASIDAARIGLTGLSDGAETAYWALQDSDRFAVAVISSPPLDPMSYSLVSEEFTNGARRLRDRAGPWPDTQDPWASHWRDKPAVNHVEQIHTPILLQLADQEALPAFPFYRRMREHDRAIEMFIYPDAYHVKHRPRQLLAAQMRALAWLDFWLRDVEVIDDADPARIGRWRALQAQASHR